MTDPFGKDGAFSDTDEYHAFAHGVYLGFTTKPRTTPPEPAKPSVTTESHYYRAGYVVGSLLQVALVVLGLAGAGVAL